MKPQRGLIKQSYMPLWMVPQVQEHKIIKWGNSNSLIYGHVNDPEQQTLYKIFRIKEKRICLKDHLQIYKYVMLLECAMLMKELVVVSNIIILLNILTALLQQYF